MRTVHFALAAALAVSATPAAAAVHFTLTGVVTSGSDNGFALPGFDAPFGTPPYGLNIVTGETYGSPIGRTFTLAITVDTSRGVHESYPFSEVYYGSDADSPGVAAFTLNGITYEMGRYSDSTAFAGLEKYNGPAEDSLGGNFVSTRNRPPMSGPFTQFSGNLTFGLGLPADIFGTPDFGEPISWSGVPTGGFGHLQIALQNTDGSPGSFVTAAARTADLYLRFDSLTVTTDPIASPGGVPEPSAWALMILGFGLAGTALRSGVRAGRPRAV